MGLISLLMSPATSAAAAGALVYGASQFGIVTNVIGAFVGGMVYLIIRPHPKRSATLWRAFRDGPRCAKVAVALADAPALAAVVKAGSAGAKPVLVLSYEADSSAPALASSSALWAPLFPSHAMAFADVPNVTLLFTPDSWNLLLPVARATLFALGGMVPYSRALLMRVLQKKPVAGAKQPLVTVALQPPISSHRACFHNKGPVSAALKAGASIVPVIHDRATGTVVVGTAVETTATAVPTAEEVRAAAQTLAKSVAVAYRTISTAKLVPLHL